MTSPKVNNRQRVRPGRIGRESKKIKSPVTNEGNNRTIEYSNHQPNQSKSISSKAGMKYTASMMTSGMMQNPASVNP